MKPKVALTLALVSGALAVGLVAADTVWNLGLRLEERNDQGGWDALAQTSGRTYIEPYPGPGSCAGPELRFVVDNYKPLPDTVRVQAWYFSGLGSTQFLLDETWSLAAFEVRTVEITVPESAFEQQNTTDDRPKFADEVFLNGRADDQNVSVCIRRGDA